MLVALLALGVSVLVALPALNRTAGDVAARISEDVGARVVQDAREQRVLTGRRELAEANSRLAGRALPIVPDPGPQATGDELLVQAARANVIADLPEDQVAGLRNLPGAPATLPSLLRDLDPRDASQDGPSAQGLSDRVVDLLPIVPGQGAVDDRRGGGGRDGGGGGSSSGSGGGSPGGGSSGSGSGPPGGGTSTRTPAPPPASGGGGGGPTTRPPDRDRPGLLEPCVLGILLC